MDAYVDEIGLKTLSLQPPVSVSPSDEREQEADRAAPRADVDRQSNNRQSDSLIQRFGISWNEFVERQKFLNFTKADAEVLQALQPLISKHADWIVDGFYENINEYEQLRGIIQGANSNVERLKVTQKQYLADMFSGRYDQKYLESRLRIGVIHFNIGLGPMWYLGSYSVYLRLITQAINRSWSLRMGNRDKAIQAVNKILFLDAQIAIDSYMLSLVNLIRDTVGHMEGGIDSQTNMVNEQTAAINETRATLDQIKEHSDEALHTSRAWGEQAERSVETGTAGLDVVKKAVDAISMVNTQIEHMAHNITLLSQSAMQIGQITGVVEGIARQSKMLAINASIEAVHAGEAGNGFSVVAAEVAELADQSAQATDQVRSVLADIQNVAEKAVVASEEGIRRMGQGVKLVDQAGEAVDTLFSLLKDTFSSSDQIVEVINSQARGIKTIHEAMRNMDVAARRLQGQSEDVRGSLDVLSSSLDRQKMMMATRDD